jgi:hypothetical protein
MRRIPRATARIYEIAIKFAFPFDLVMLAPNYGLDPLLACTDKLARYSDETD